MKEDNCSTEQGTVEVKAVHSDFDKGHYTIDEEGLGKGRGERAKTPHTYDTAYGHTA